MVETDDVAFGWSGEGEEEEEECEGKVDYCHVALYCVVIGEIRLQKCIIFCSLDNPKKTSKHVALLLYNDWLI